LILLAVLVWIGAATPLPVRASDAAAGRLSSLVSAICPADGVGNLKDISLEESEERELRAGLIRLDQRYLLSGSGSKLEVMRIEQNGLLLRFAAELYERGEEGLRPVMQALAGGDCGILGGARISVVSEGLVLLQRLAADLDTVTATEKLEVPWPEGKDPGGPRVALVDSGLAYDLPLFADRLARDESGAPLGYDFWDMDPRPYDADISRSPFLPIRHGTMVASVIVRETETAALIPYRYPRPDMERLGDLVERAAAARARILVMPLGSNKPEDWRAFEVAMKEHPELLAIISAGNNGRNLDEAPLWPGALRLENALVVTSSDLDGRLGPGSNWGPKSVDLMIPAEEVRVINFRGGEQVAAGSSFAVPLVAAMALRILADNPEIATSALKDEILSHATGLPGDEVVVSHGWIRDPSVP
jgi:hypothetical protein